MPTGIKAPQADIPRQVHDEEVSRRRRDQSTHCKSSIACFAREREQWAFRFLHQFEPGEFPILTNTPLGCQKLKMSSDIDRSCYNRELGDVKRLLSWEEPYRSKSAHIYLLLRSFWVPWQLGTAPSSVRLHFEFVQFGSALLCFYAPVQQRQSWRRSLDFGALPCIKFLCSY